MNLVKYVDAEILSSFKIIIRKPHLFTLFLINRLPQTVVKLQINKPMIAKI